MIIDQQFVEAIKQKFKPEDYSKAIALVHQLKKWSKFEEEYQEQVQKLSTKHIRECLPQQVEINNLVNGQRIPTEEELKNEYNITGKEAEPLPEYWSKVFQHCGITANKLSQKDIDIFNHLKSITAQLGENDKDFKLRFEFEDNQFFNNKILEKEFIFHNEENDLPYKSNGTQINWKDGKNVTKTIKKKKQRNKKTNQTRIIEQEVKLKSFFNFFNDIAPAQTEQEEEIKQNLLARDLEIGEAILEEIIPESLAYYLDVKDDEEDIDEDEEDEESGEQESDEDD